MTRLYLSPLPTDTTDKATDQIGSEVQQAGLIEGSGTAVENVATDTVDFRKTGRIQYGPTLNRKFAEELDSLSESAYTALPVFDPSDGSLGRKRGYYEIERIDVTPAQESRDDAYEYDVSLAKAGTREDSRRAVTTNPQAVDSVYSDATAAPVIGIPASATDVRWYDDASGTEPATAVETVEAEFGTVARYDPTNATATAPTLTYDLAFGDDGPTDVRVLDSRDRLKFATTASGSEVNTWIHAYDTAYQFDGAAVIDTGRFRLVLDGDLHLALNATDLVVAAGETVTVPSGTGRVDKTLTVESGGTFIVEDGAEHVLTDGTVGDAFAAAAWDDALGYWEPIPIDATSSWSLTAWSLTRVRPSRVEVQTLWSDGTDETRLDATLERGADGVVWTVPENATAPPQAVVDLLTPTSRATDETAIPTQTLRERSRLED